jgi:hypothetical protein
LIRKGNKIYIKCETDWLGIDIQVKFQIYPTVNEKMWKNIQENSHNKQQTLQGMTQIGSV